MSSIPQTQQNPLNREITLIFPQEPANLQPDRLLTDRSTYIAYLESQLERVTGACLTVQSFDQRIEAVTHAARSLEEKVWPAHKLMAPGKHSTLTVHLGQYIHVTPRIPVSNTSVNCLQVLNTGRLLKCSQAYSEEHESVQKQVVAELTGRVQQLESAATSAESHGLHWEAAQEHALQVLVSLIGPWCMVPQGTKLVLLTSCKWQNLLHKHAMCNSRWSLSVSLSLLLYLQMQDSF